MRIGCCWAGSPRFARDTVRSIPYPVFAPLFDVPGTSWVALFTGAARDQAPRHPNLECPDLPDLLTTVRLMRDLDLMVTIDSLPAHLAGTLGVPTLLLLPYAADWRWLRDRDTTPWYPSVTLVRAAKWGDWTDVVERVRHDLTVQTRKVA
jgi:ADP-heptose:LPS heptosyltransferase